MMYLLDSPARFVPVLLGLFAATVAQAGDALPACALAQQVIAGTKLVADVQYPEDHEAFVASKAYDEPFVVQQFLSNPAPGDESLMRTLSCKMRTSERINTAHAPGPDEAVASGDSSCAEVQRQLLRRAFDTVPVAEQVLNPAQVVIEEEQSTFMGPMWLNPWPFHAASSDGSGGLRLHSRALYVPRAWWIPLPARFQGNYYCHLAAPAYLEALLRGERTPET